ncbi:DUF72 domain-containing protein [Sphingoaurantiacus capsulatus]|uniref:DUF72 domain-containing protein n=1 Tax=Sphingoaurantiacus capsulatus TaxID=1771310 RepID=A0ABV7XG16_9SPHN
MSIKVGIGGWTFEPWRGVFYPEKHPQARELEYAGKALTSIEVNGTFYSTMKPATFQKWAAETPDDFVFSLKASRYAVNRKLLATAGESIERFIGSGIGELKSKLGPILWQFAGTKKYEPDDFAAFLDLLPAEVDGLKLRHVVEPRHESFRVPEFIELARQKKVAVVFADSDDYPAIPDLTADFVYARLQRSVEDVTTGYDAKALDRWAKVAKEWAAGEAPKGLDYVHPEQPKARARDAFIYLISGAKVRNPAAAMALIERVGGR